MFIPRPHQERGVNQLPWLFARHSFSFGEYQDPKHMGFRDLRVINEDVVAPSGGFATHGHRNMEILTYVLSGKLRHRDTLGHEGELSHGVVQLMSAGSGIRHSEFNGSDEEPLHLLQIWIYPKEDEIPASYNQKDFEITKSKNKLHLLASPEKDKALYIHQDAKIYAGIFGQGKEVTLPLEKTRHGWLQVARGTVEVGGKVLEEGDGLAISDVASPALKARDEAEFLFFDLA